MVREDIEEANMIKEIAVLTSPLLMSGTATSVLLGRSFYPSLISACLSFNLVSIELHAVRLFLEG